jgi:hypothetical protein
LSIDDTLACDAILICASIDLAILRLKYVNYTSGYHITRPPRAMPFIRAKFIIDTFIYRYSPAHYAL